MQILYKPRFECTQCTNKAEEVIVELFLLPGIMFVGVLLAEYVPWGGTKSKCELSSFLDF